MPWLVEKCFVDIQPAVASGKGGQQEMLGSGSRRRELEAVASRYCVQQAIDAVSDSLIFCPQWG
jgi:hypothetical protein